MAKLVLTRPSSKEDLDARPSSAGSDAYNSDAYNSDNSSSQRPYSSSDTSFSIFDFDRDAPLLLFVTVLEILVCGAACRTGAIMFRTRKHAQRHPKVAINDESLSGGDGILGGDGIDSSGIGAGIGADTGYLGLVEIMYNIMLNYIGNYNRGNYYIGNYIIIIIIIYF